MKTGDLFPVAEYFLANHRVQFVGEFRQPKAGEWYISGAVPEGYKAHHDLTAKYHIGRLVTIRTESIVTVVDDCQTDGQAQSRHEHGTSDCASPYLWRPA